VLRHRPDRAARSWSDFDRRTWTARLGMAGETRAEERMGVVVEGLPGRLEVSVETGGDLRRLGPNSLLGLRIDYGVGTGYARSVLVHGPCGTAPDLHDPARDAPVPWGTRRTEDRVVAVMDLSRFDLLPGEHAPEGWTGRALITFVLEDAGPGARATIRLSAEPSPRRP
jgi:xylan 1,4-beta-xylosidase